MACSKKSSNKKPLSRPKLMSRKPSFSRGGKKYGCGGKLKQKNA